MNRRQIHTLIVCSLLALIIGALLAACDDNGTPTLPQGPLNTTLNQKAGVSHLSNTGGSSKAAPLLAAPAPAPDVAYILFFPQGDAVLPPDPGEEFTFAVNPEGEVVMQAQVGEIETAPEGKRSFAVPQGEQWTLSPGTSEVTVVRLEEAPLLNLDRFVPPQGTEAPSVIPTVPAEKPIPVTPLPEGELEIWHPWAGGPEEEMLRAAVGWFREQYPDVEIRVEDMDWGELREKFATSAAAGIAPDLVLASSDVAIEWAAQDLIQPLDDVEEQGRLADVYSTALDTLRYEGRLWGTPFRASTVALYYDRELLPEPPSTTDDLRAMVEEGFSLAIPDHVYYTYGFLEGYGGRLVDEGGNVVVESEGTYAYLKFVRDLIWSDDVHYASAGEVQPLFQDYGAAMIVDGVWMMPAYRESLGNALGVAPLPQVPETGRWPAPVLGSDACLVSAATSDAEREAAVAFALLLTGEEFQELLIREGGTIPVNRWVSIDDAALFMFFKQANLASPGFVHPDRGVIWGVAQRMLERVLEEWSPEEAAKSAAAELREAGVGQ